MVSGGAAADAVDLARRLPRLRVGLHLVLVDGVPTLPPERIPDLVDRDGRLPSDLAAFGRRIVLRPRARRQLAAEIDAQFAAFAATGLPLDHVNAHHHFHVHPTVGALVLDVGRRYGMRSLRVPREPSRLIERIEPGVRAPRSRAVAAWIGLLGWRVRARGVAAADRVFGLAWSGAMTEARVAGIVAHLPDGVSEVYFHPATRDRFAGAAAGYRYEEELAALMSPQVRALVDASGARTGGLSELGTP